MRVAVNARTLSADSLRGWSRYTLNLFRTMSHMDVEILLLSDRKLNPLWLEGFHGQNTQVQIQSSYSYLHWQQVVQKELCETHRVDILHCPVHFGLPMGEMTAKKVLTLHDAIEVAYVDKQLSFLQKLSLRRIYARLLNRLSRQAADHIVTVSQASSNDLKRYYGLPAERVSVVYEGADRIFDREFVLPRKDIENRWGCVNPYFFYIGGLEERKNIGRLIQAFAQLSTTHHDLVLAGGSPGDIQALKLLAQQSHCEKRVHFLGAVEECYLPSLYAHAHCFVYPSLYEGFGLQLVEAMQMECPVLTSNVTSLPEIYNFPSAHFNPRDVISIGNKMEGSLGNEKFISEQKAFQKIRVQDFSWEGAARDTLEVYRKILLKPVASV